MLFGAAGIVLFAITPVVMNKGHFVNDVIDSDFTISMNVNFNGNGEVVYDGEHLGSAVDDIENVDKEDWDLWLIDAGPYPDIVYYLSFIGLGLAFLGIFLSIFGYNDGLRVAGAILGFLGAGLAITGCFLLYNWNIEFQEDAYFFMMVNAGFTGTTYSDAYSTFGMGWLAAVISSGLIAIGSIILIATKPKK